MPPDGRTRGVHVPATAADVEIADVIVNVRRERVILDSDLARLYGVSTKQIATTSSICATPRRHI
jgi:hypothetical protein